MTAPTLRPGLALLTAILVLWASSGSEARPTTEKQDPAAANAIVVQYLEVVTPNVDETCEALEKVHGVSFGPPVAEFGNARTANLEGGGRVGVRAPMREDEHPVVRPYILVSDIEAAVEAAEAAGGLIAMPPTAIPGHGRFAIYIQGGIQHGLWQP